MTTSDKGKTRAITIRFTDAEFSAIQELAERFGVSTGVIVRWSCEALLNHVDHHGGELHLPLDLSSTWKKYGPKPKKKA